MGLTLAEVPSRVSGEIKEGLLKLVDEAVVGGWPHARACRMLGVSDVRVHRWRKRLAEIGSRISRREATQCTGFLVGRSTRSWI